MSTFPFPTGAQVVLPPDADGADWHAARRTGIGGSDIAAICGLNPWTSPLEIWHAKAGTPVPRRDDGALSEAALMGHLLEPIVAARFADLTGLPVFDHPGTLRRPDISWALVNLDRVTLDNGEHGVLELKTRSSYALADWENEPPTDTTVQVQWQLAVTGWAFGYAACLIGGQRTVVHRIERDEQMIADLLAIGSEFWGWVQDSTPPPLDGTPATGALLDRLHAQPTAGEVVVADPYEVEGLIKQRATAKEQIAAGELALQDAENRMKAICGDATEVHVRGDRAYSWPQFSRRGSVDWRRLAAEHPEVDLDGYRKPSTTYRTLRIHLEDV